MADEFTKAALYGIKTFNKKVKEKIGIEKLIALLNEFETPQSGVVFKSYDDYDGTFYGVDIDGETEIAWSDSYICGKRFGWIEWLVENDKIRKDIYRPIPIGIKATYEDGVVYYDKLEDRIIMLLSISSSPIEDLIGFLKNV